MFAYHLPDAVVWPSTALALLVLFEAARRARWNDHLLAHTVWALATAAVLLGQRMGIALESGLQLHYLGSAFLALLVGYPRALLSMAVVLLASPLVSPDLDPGNAILAWRNWGPQMLVGALIPIWTLWSIVQLSKKRLPTNLFVFLLGCGLFGLLLSYGVQLVASASLYAFFAPMPPRDFLDIFMPYALLLASGEAWLEGMVITILVVYVPGSVVLFDEAHYLRRP